MIFGTNTYLKFLKKIKNILNERKIFTINKSLKKANKYSIHLSDNSYTYPKALGFFKIVYSKLIKP